MRFSVWTLFFVLSGVAVFLLNSCSPKTGDTALPLELEEDFSEAGAAPVAERWWTDFNDPVLDSIVGLALDSNFNLYSAWYRLEAARQVVERESGDLWPQFDLGAQAGANYPQPDFVGGENVRVGINASYEVDLWGRIRSRVEAEEYRAVASFYDYHTAAISLSAEVARNWYRLLGAHQRLQLASSQINTNQKILRLIRARFGSGQIRAVDILRQQQLLQASKEQKIAAERDIQNLEHSLSVLLAQPPQRNFRYKIDSLPQPPALPEAGLPSELIQRRPDIQRDFNFLKAADRDLASAVSAKYPRLNLSASMAARNNDFSGLFNDLAYSIGANLLAPLFYGGRLDAEADRNEALRQQAIYQYGQTVLTAFREVEDAIVNEAKQKQRIEVLQRQVELGEQSYGQLQNQYFNGISDYLAVLTILDQQQQLQRDLLAARIAMVELRINLHRALAGGFELEKEEID